MHLAQDRSKWRAVVNTVMNDRSLLHVIILVKRLTPVGSCSLATLHCSLTPGSGSSHCSLVSHASNRGCLDSFSGQSTRHL